MDGEDTPTIMNRKRIDLAIYASSQHTYRLEQQNKLGVLTRDMAAAIYIYTLESPFYKVLNKLLRDVDRSVLKPYFPFLKLILTGLRRLRKEHRTVFRGIPVGFAALDGAEHYLEGCRIVWWPFSSSTENKKVLSDKQFLGVSGPRTLFVIDTSTARNIRQYSAIQKEDERLILPGTPFTVISVVTDGDLTTISLHEDQSAPDGLIASGDGLYESTNTGMYDLLSDASKAPRKVRSQPIYMNEAEVAAEAVASTKKSDAYEDHVILAPSAKVPDQCTRPNPNGGLCKRRQIKRSLFCKGHTCNFAGCTSSKSSKARMCTQHDLSTKGGESGSGSELDL
jgi:hypothetical protein